MMRIIGFCFMIIFIIALITTLITEYKSEYISSSFYPTLVIIFIGFEISIMIIGLSFL